MTTRSPATVWYLEMSSSDALRRRDGPGTVTRSGVPLGALNRFFYREVGRDFHWVDRLGWTAHQWQSHAERTELWLVHDRGTPAGYAELWKLPRGRWHLAMFGLLAPFRGRGLGAHLLTAVARRAWSGGAATVTLDTCELDGPHALPNYRARGFEVVRESIEQRGRGEGSRP